MNKDYREQLMKLQELLNSVSYRYKMKWEVKQYKWEPHLFQLNTLIKAECAYMRNGTEIDLKFERQFPVQALEEMIQDFNRWIRIILWDIEKHELDEWLLINGERVFDPHPENKKELVK